jgi:hypothetical protein
MTDGAVWLRRAGRGRLANGGLVLWSVAEGGRGRRWRWVHQIHEGLMGPAGLIELLPGGGLGRLELSAFGGLLTFHPEADRRSAHGNIVSAERVHPIETAWKPDWGVGIVGDAFGSAVGGWDGSGLVLTYDHDGIVWREPGRHADVESLASDGRGIPILDDADEWALEG